MSPSPNLRARVLDGGAQFSSGQSTSAFSTPAGSTYRRAAKDEPKITASAEREFWTAAECGKHIRLSGKRIYQLAATDPSFPRVKIEGSVSVRFPRKRVLKWLAARTQKEARGWASRPSHRGSA